MTKETTTISADKFDPFFYHLIIECMTALIIKRRLFLVKAASAIMKGRLRCRMCGPASIWVNDA